MERTEARTWPERYGPIVFRDGSPALQESVGQKATTAAVSRGTEMPALAFTPNRALCTIARSPKGCCTRSHL